MKSSPLKIVASRSRQKLEDLSDDELMLLVSRDAEAPFEVLIDRHQGLILGYTTRFLGDRDLACEVTQEVFFDLWNARKKYRASGKLRAFLLTLAVNRSRNIVRKRKTAGRKLDEFQAGHIEDDPQIPIEQLLEAERIARLLEQLTQLSSRTRTVLVLRFSSGLRYEEIAEITNQPLGTVKSLASRGLKKLNSRLAPEDKV